MEGKLGDFPMINSLFIVDQAPHVELPIQVQPPQILIDVWGLNLRFDVARVVFFGGTCAMCQVQSSLPGAWFSYCPLFFSQMETR